MTTEQRASEFFRKLLAGQPPALQGGFPDLGPWTEPARLVVDAHTKGGIPAAAAVCDALCVQHPDIRVLLAPPLEDKKSGSDATFPFLTSGFSPLPAEANMPDSLRRESWRAARWLNTYMAFSKHWSPRAYEGFHETVAVWLLSTIAARRVALNLGPQKQYTPLFLALTSKTSVYAKTTTARLGINLLKQAGLGWLLAPDDATPQAFIRDLAGKDVPSNYAAMDPAVRAWTASSLAFSGQRGWYYDEFSMLLDSLGKKGGHMSEFRGILRKMDDCDESFTYSSIARGRDSVAAPYLAMLVNMTPADLRVTAAKNDRMWQDGFWARWVFVTPERNDRKKDRFPLDEFSFPNELVVPLSQWHERLGMPDFEIGVEGESSQYEVRYRGPLPESVCDLAPDVYNAYYTYHDALGDLVAEFDDEDLAGNYTRHANKALRIAMLLASLENDGRIEMEHWCIAQDICERWRQNLHNLFVQVNEPQASPNEKIEANILRWVEKLSARGQFMDFRMIRQQIKGPDTETLRRIVESLVRAEMLVEIMVGKKKYYAFPREESAEAASVAALVK